MYGFPTTQAFEQNLGYNATQMTAIGALSGNGIVGGIGLVLFYGFSFWRIFKGNPGNKVIACGSVALMVFVAMIALFKIPNFPVRVLASLGFLLFLLCLLTMFFLAQRGYRAPRTRKASSD
jgi:hypothetical protein